MWRVGWLIAAWSFAAPAAVAGQVPADSAAGAGIPVLSGVWRTLSDPGRAGWVRPLASAIVPGIGQLLGRRSRGAVYLIAEALLVTRFIALNREGRRERERFLDLGFVVARGAFAPSTRDTAFEYFEQMGNFIESGAFDTDPGIAVVPPLDERTFNGAIWALARRTFFADPDNPPATDSPDYQRALAFYSRRAIGPDFQWSWRNAGLEQDLFRQTIRESDEAFRAATQQLGLLLANHILSAVDTFISHRLSGPNREITTTSFVRVRPRWPASLEHGMAVRIAF